MSTKAALVLAAGKGTRMHSDRPKVLQTVLGEPMLAFVLAALEPEFGEDVFIVAGHRHELVEQAVPHGRFVLQQEQLGTGHALREAMPALRAAGAESVLVVNGDAPLVTAKVIKDFVAQAQKADLAFATINLDNPGAYGRVVRQDGHIAGIVEAKDYDEAKHGVSTGEVNAGLYLVRMDLAERLLPRVGNANRSGEYYITDLVALALEDGASVKGIVCGNDESLLGVNSPLELAGAERILQERINRALLESGVILHSPETVRISPFASIEPGAEITGPCEVTGRTCIGSGARIFANCVIRDARIDGGCEIRPFTHVEQAHVGRGALVGPYSRLRPGAHIDVDAHVGNFVELKKSHLGPGAKANHLSYLGDAEIGAGANIGAGTITCNYDGKNKFKTAIGAHAFIGSNTALVAPVSVGDNATIGAGSTITKDVPEGELAVARQKQRNLGKYLKK
ncbi:MAG: bifunctional UDP-N-acetylglucosamine diphosphorylase/glucosamine-1-phosphate N-acetyltransferase GlmU [Desulfovibrio sp.]|jgi:bifunctional UDP-N-acetylglucosamine pyrophosphorylase/glucosamine-1-phosphate N-acetyltransferase|nr:bifunctional UDP-N-acetylglucosamine diphosphorylase/glucosamine-1-phosphate N-acetyltransferase GlmU [Desulfovibrio sp.]